MDFRKLSYFLKVMETANFTKAAQVLGVSQAALSHQVAALENEMQMQLFYRTGRGVRATEAGNVFARRANAILCEFGEAKEDLERLRQAPSGNLRLGVPPSVSHALVASFALKVRMTFPKVILSIIEGSSGFISEWLAQDRLDLGILYKLGDAIAPTEDFLLSEELSLVGKENDSLIAAGNVSFERVTYLPLILPSRPHGLRILLERIASQKGVVLEPIMELDGAAMIPSLVSSGCGYSILPNVTVQLDMKPKGIDCCHITDPALQRKMVIAAPHQSRARRTTRAAINLLKEQVDEFTRVPSPIYGDAS